MPLLFKYPVKRGEVDPVLDRPNRSPVYMKSVRTGVKKKKRVSTVDSDIYRFPPGGKL